MSLFEYESNAIRAMLQDRFYALLLVCKSG